MSTFMEDLKTRAQHRVAALQADMGKKESAIAELQAELKAMAEEVAEIERVLAATAAPEKPKPKPKPARIVKAKKPRRRKPAAKPKPTPDPPAAPAEGEPESDATGELQSPGSSAQTPERVSLEAARDFAVTASSGGQTFTTPQMAQYFNITGHAAKVLCAALEKQGTIRRPPGSKPQGRGAKWEHAPLPKDAPNVRPRGEERIAPVVPISRGETVPHTGKPHGPSGKPGLDKKRAEQGHTVKRARQGT